MRIQSIKSILVLGSDSILVLPVVRALGVLLSDAAINTLSPASERYKPQRFSRHNHGHYTFSYEKEKIFLNDLLDVIEKTKASILLPVDEKYVRLVSSLKKELEQHVLLPPLPEVSNLDSLVNKKNLANTLKKNHLPGAVSQPLQDVVTGKTAWNLFPCLLKPVMGSSGTNIFLLKNKSVLRNTVKQLPVHEYIIQEYLPGSDIDCSLLAVNGEIKAYTIQKGLESRNFSFSTAIRFEKDDQLFQNVKKLIRRTGYSGLAHLDYRLDERDNRMKLIDFNARFWVSMPGSIAAGVNFPFLICLAALKLPFESIEFREINYMMGKSSFNHFRLRNLSLRRNSDAASSPVVYTDAWNRLSDPLPELVRYTHRTLDHFRNRFFKHNILTLG